METISEVAFEKTNTPIDEFVENGFIIEKDGKMITIRKDNFSKSLVFKYVAFVSFVDENYIGLISGLPTFDAGWMYLIYLLIQIL